MPPKVQRSRACAQCRNRRVKCDETPEICNQCRRLGLECSGPVIGSVVIDMTEKMAKPRGRKKKDNARAAIALRDKPGNPVQSAPQLPPLIVPTGRKLPTVDMPVPSPNSPTERRYPLDYEKAITAIRHIYKPPTYYQPSRIKPEALDNAFLAHYVHLNSGSRTYSPEIQWLNHLPRIHAEATKPAVRLSLRAVSMAYYAKLQHDPSILLDSWRWYTISLNAQRMSIARLKGKEIPTEGEVLVPLILALYEVYVGTTDSGAMLHLAAAAKIMDMRGPQNVKTGVIWPLFKGIRNVEAHKSIVFGKPSKYASPEWMNIPFEGMPRDAHQRLADVEFMIPVAMQKLGIQGTLRTFFTTPIPANTDVEPCREVVLKLIADLKQWALEFPNLTNVASNLKDITDFKGKSAKGLDVANENSQADQSPDTFVALIASKYVATKLALAGIMHKIAKECGTPPGSTIQHDYYAEAEHCARAILHGAAYLENSQTLGFDLMRGIGPLVSVACIGPGREHLMEAGIMLHRWGTKISGLNSIINHHILGSGGGEGPGMEEMMAMRAKETAAGGGAVAAI